MTTETSFLSNGTKLVGRLVMPQGSGQVPVVVLIHGAENDSARDLNSLQRMFPSQGIAAFVYDKRGTGASEGTYTQDFDKLANDAVLAAKEARRLAGNRAGRVGFQGASEGGWVAPLAANRSAVDFVVVSFGLAVSVIQEDEESVALDMQLHHHSARETAEARELARAGEHVFETSGADGYRKFDELRHRFRSRPWFKDVHGDFLFLILPLEKAQIVDALTNQFHFFTPFRYDPMPTLRVSTTPQLWILGEDDLEAPSAETGKRIQLLIARGKPFTLAVFPGAEHGMTEYETDANGRRTSTRFSADYFQMMSDFVRDGKVGGRFGKAKISRPR